jgi:carboxylate-amine ligase
MENKWRAARCGINGKMIDFGKQTQVPVRDLILEYLKFVDDVVGRTGVARREIEYVPRLWKWVPEPTGRSACSKRPAI